MGRTAIPLAATDRAVIAHPQLTVAARYSAFLAGTWIVGGLAQLGQAEG